MLDILEFIKAKIHQLYVPKPVTKLTRKLLVGSNLFTNTELIYAVTRFGGLTVNELLLEIEPVKTTDIRLYKLYHVMTTAKYTMGTFKYNYIDFYDKYFTKVIFLDVDGVLNIISDSYNSVTLETANVMEDYLVQRLEYLIKQTGAYIVLTSSWKTDMATFHRVLKEHSVYVDNQVIGTIGFNLNPCEALAEFVFREKIINYAVLGNTSMFICGEQCLNIMVGRIIHVEKAQGLTDKNVNKTINILDKRFKEKK